jgi:glutathione S-transferase
MSNKITIYTAHHCPFAHRVQIILRELSLDFETCLVDITIPRTPEYLAINPNGMVPALVHNNVVLTESSLICQFLADSYPSHLLLPSSVPGGALQRFRIDYFVETYSSKAHGLFDSTVFSNSAEAKIDMANKYVDAVVKYVEPLLVDSGPFYGGSNRLTLAEVSTRWPLFVVEKQLTTILCSRC